MIKIIKKQIDLKQSQGTIKQPKKVYQSSAVYKLIMIKKNDIAYVDVNTY